MKHPLFFLSTLLIIAGLFFGQIFRATAQTIRKGSSGTTVTELQQFLSAYPLIYPEKTVSGYFGVKTEAAVRRFQKTHGILQTGIVGPKTQAKINELSLPKRTTPVVPKPPPPPPPPPPKPQASPPLVDPPPPPLPRSSPAWTLSDEWSQGKCIGTGPKTLTSSPVRLNDILYIDPMGAMSGSHVTPVDHLYFHGYKIDKNRFDVLSPADGFVVLAEKVPGPDDYRLVIEHSCTFFSIYIHITTLAKKVNDAVGVLSSGQRLVRIPIAAGEVIGTKTLDLSRGATQVDFSIANDEVTLTGFIVPEHYTGEPWKIHTVDPYEYYAEPLKSQLVAKTNRALVPIAGKIDYDIDGRLVGNWFLEGTNGYSGASPGNPRGYWIGHLTIAYDYYDPKKIRVSTGDWEGVSEQFAVRGNAPDPKDVGVSSGAVSYELVRTQYIRSTGAPWDWSGIAKDITLDTNTDIKGTMLVQLLAPRRLKVEFFPGKAAAEVNGFSLSARVYER